MLIKSIEVRGFARKDPETGEAEGIVAFMTEDATIHLTCRSAFLPRSAETLRRRLINDAVRQLQRMPEFRAGHKQFSFAPGLV